MALCLSLNLILHYKHFPSSLIQATFNLVIKRIKISSKRENLKSFKYSIVKMYHKLSTLLPLLGFKLCLIFATVNKQYHHEILWLHLYFLQACLHPAACMYFWRILRSTATPLKRKVFWCSFVTDTFTRVGPGGYLTI